MPNRQPFSPRHLEIAENGTTTVVTAATTLNPSQCDVEVQIPLASADSYAITLPPVGQCNGMRFTFIARRITGTYVDGEVTIQDQDDNLITNLASDGLTASGDYLAIDNLGGRIWVTAYDVTT